MYHVYHRSNQHPGAASSEHKHTVVKPPIVERNASVHSTETLPAHNTTLTTGEERTANDTKNDNEKNNDKNKPAMDPPAIRTTTVSTALHRIDSTPNENEKNDDDYPAEAFLQEFSYSSSSSESSEDDEEDEPYVDFIIHDDDMEVHTNPAVPSIYASSISLSSLSSSRDASSAKEWTTHKHANQLSHLSYFGKETLLNDRRRPPVIVSSAIPETRSSFSNLWKGGGGAPPRPSTKQRPVLDPPEKVASNDNNNKNNKKKKNQNNSTTNNTTTKPKKKKKRPPRKDMKPTKQPSVKPSPAPFFYNIYEQPRHHHCPPKQLTKSFRRRHRSKLWGRNYQQRQQHCAMGSVEMAIYLETGVC